MSKIKVWGKIIEPESHKGEEVLVEIENSYKNSIISWWNRKWTNWECINTYSSYEDGWRIKKITYKLYESKSNDGLKKYKSVIVKKYIE